KCRSFVIIASKLPVSHFNASADCLAATIWTAGAIMPAVSHVSLTDGRTGSKQRKHADRPGTNGNTVPELPTHAPWIQGIPFFQATSFMRSLVSKLSVA